MQDTTAAAPVQASQQSPTAQRIAYFLKVARACVRQVLNSAYVTEDQRQRAEQKIAQTEDPNQLMKWHAAVNNYVAAVRSGRRQPLAL